MCLRDSIIYTPRQKSKLGLTLCETQTTGARGYVLPPVPKKELQLSPPCFHRFFITKPAHPPVAEARSAILAQILLPEAADRLGRIRLVKESRAIDVENRLIMLAKSGQLRSKVTEDQLKELLGAVAENTQREGGAAGKIVISRRKGDWDDDDDLLDF